MQSVQPDITDRDDGVVAYHDSQANECNISSAYERGEEEEGREKREEEREERGEGGRERQSYISHAKTQNSKLSSNPRLHVATTWRAARNPRKPCAFMHGACNLHGLCHSRTGFNVC